MFKRLEDTLTKMNVSINGGTDGSFIISLLCGINELIEIMHLEYWLAQGQLFSMIISHLYEFFQSSFQMVSNIVTISLIERRTW